MGSLRLGRRDSGTTRPSVPRAQRSGFQECPANPLDQEPASRSRECPVPPPYATPVMPLSRWLRSVGVFLLPAPCWAPRERWLGAPGAWHGARCWCQAWTEEPRALYSSLRMNGNQKLDPYDQRKQDFIQHFSQIVKVLTEDGTGHPEIGDAIARLKEVLEYNAVGGKYQRGLTVLTAYQELAGPETQDADSVRRALTVGWCVELVRRWGGILGAEEGEPEPDFST
ncbi:farnesyl pyrophosphate synthase-like [Suricata suricatta]|uniref:farnesyl pyrophosphate synthase-like n=1 Tax=Suricata suricatta TaxID=37032 RepID=UPI0011554668|nr:farnesyl pyrophosphate synthase-like [Suricata suricatta]